MVGLQQFLHMRAEEIARENGWQFCRMPRHAYKAPRRNRLPGKIVVVRTALSENQRLDKLAKRLSTDQYREMDDFPKGRELLILLEAEAKEMHIPPTRYVLEVLDRKRKSKCRPEWFDHGVQW